MKKILTIFAFILIAKNTYSQKISPYFPQKFYVTTQNKYETQVTYFDLNFVTLKIQDYMSYEFGMTLNDEKMKYELKDGKGFITYAFIEKIAINSKPKELFFKFKVFPIEKDLVIEKLKITGNENAVLKFYVSFWTTTLNFDDVKKKEIVSNRIWQDRISYSYNNRNSFIEIDNTTIKSNEDFITKYQINKKEFNKKEKISAEKRKLEKIKIQKQKEEYNRKLIAEKKVKEEKREKERNTKITRFEYRVIKKKRKLKYEKTNSYFKDEISKKINLHQEFSKFLANKEKGTYLIIVKYTEIYNELQKTEFKVKKYTKQKGILDIARETVGFD